MTPSVSPFSDTVAGVGITEAQTENIAIGSALPGVAVQVWVPVDQFGVRVKAGDRFFPVDDR